MISVDKAEELVLNQAKDFGVEIIALDQVLGRVLAEPVLADRDYPPGNRSTMDGIAVKYDNFSKGNRNFFIHAIQPAGQKPITNSKPNQCIQIMTGGILGKSVDTVIKIEDVEIVGPYASVKTNDVLRDQFVHKKGSDRKKNNLVIEPGVIIGAKEIAVLASLGYSKIKVKKIPKIIFITTGGELVDVGDKAKDYQIRRSNDRAIASVLAKFSVGTDRVHLPDDKQDIKNLIKKSIQKYDIILLSGGVSKGEFDYVQIVLEELKVKKIFHGISQRPGKPFWFGSSGNKLVFAFPGNPVSAFLCLHRYFLPWLVKSLGLKIELSSLAMLDDKVDSTHLTQFIPAKIRKKNAMLFAKPIENNGSGDFISLVNADVFIEIPTGVKSQKGSLQKIWHII